MAASLCKLTVLKVYEDVIEDVINNVREVFLEDGVDEQVLQELKSTWKAKLLASKAVDNKASKPVEPAGFPKAQQVVGQVQPNNHVQTSVTQIDNKMVPIQITLPAQPGTNVGQRVLTIQVPSTAFQGNQLQKVLTGPVITAAMRLPQLVASNMLQQHVNAAFSNQQVVDISSLVNKTVTQTDGVLDEFEPEPMAGCSTVESNQFQIKQLTEPNQTRAPTDAVLCEMESSMAGCSSSKRKQFVIQVDGPEDTSDDDVSVDEDESDDGDDDKDEEEQEPNEDGLEEDPLNSEDDVSEEESNDLFDTDNVVVCQYDKITRSRNKWKFNLKDGIMNLSGEDYVFQRANGDAEW